MERKTLQKLEQITHKDPPSSDQTDGGSFVIQSATVLANNPIAATLHPRSCAFPLHGHDYMELMYVCDGHVVHNIGGKQVDVHKGGLLILNKFVTHSVKSADPDDIGINLILPDAFLTTILQDVSDDSTLARFVADNMKHDGAPQYLLFDIGNIYPIRNLLDNIIYSVVADEKRDFPLLPKAVSLLFDYLSVYPETLVESDYATDREAAFRNAVGNYIQTEYATATLAELSRRMGLSQEYLCRKISHTYARNFKQLLVEQRLLKTADFYRQKHRRNCLHRRLRQRRTLLQTILRQAQPNPQTVARKVAYYTAGVHRIKFVSALPTNAYFLSQIPLLMTLFISFEFAPDILTMAKCSCRALYS